MHALLNTDCDWYLGTHPPECIEIYFDIWLKPLESGLTARWFLTINHSAMRVALPSFAYGLSLINLKDDT